MDLVKAKLLLEIESTEEETILDSYEEKIFQQIQIFLKDPVIPKLFESRMIKITDLQKARDFLLSSKIKADFPKIELTDLSNELNWESFFAAYEKNKSILRLTISSQYDVEVIRFLIDNLLKNEMNYAQMLIHNLGHIPIEEVKSTEALGTVKLLVELRNLKNNKLIDDTLVSLKKPMDKNLIFSLSMELSRLKKLYGSF